MTGTIAAVVFITLIVSLVLTVPIGFSLGIASLGYILYTGQLTPGFIAQNMVTGCDSFPTMAIPFFIFAGELMGGGGISKRLLNLASVFFGRISGGLAIVTVVVCMFFAAISGSGPATVAAVGGMVVPTMLEKGYDKKFVLALIAAAGSIGVIIPPSIPMVIYAVTTNSSVSSLFLAGFVPGLLIGLVLIGYSYFYAKKNGYKGDDEPFSWSRALHELKEGFWAILSPVIILGGIYGGIFTPTEAAAVSVIYSLIVGCFIYKELDLKKLLDVTRNACETTASILIVIGCAAGFSKVLTLGRIPATVATGMLSLTDSVILILLLINILLLIVGCFMETLCAIMILAPILFPVVTSLGVDPIHFGIIMVVNLAIGFITPPLGVNLFVASRVGETTLDNVIKGIIPFLFLMIATLLLITYVPAISMFLPNLLG
ncbi:MAG: TRAP transporter large permease [Anaerotignum sp.]|nr:TRAP transporter large permease [Anaerotignum sp.]